MYELFYKFIKKKFNKDFDKCFDKNANRRYIAHLYLHRWKLQNSMLKLSAYIVAILPKLDNFTVDKCCSRNSIFTVVEIQILKLPTKREIIYRVWAYLTI